MRRGVSTPAARADCGIPGGAAEFGDVAGAAAGGWAGTRLRFECASGTGVRRAGPAEVFGVWHSGAQVCAGTL